MASSILVVGSSNTDMVIKTAKFPVPGETILGGEFFMFPGGKGANQAVAASRLGGKVTLLAKVGDDIFGKQALEQFRNEGIDTTFTITDGKNPSGTALITVDGKGENTIVVAQGANGTLSPADLQHVEKEINKYDILLIQLEIPMETVRHATSLASKNKKKVILNPAPAASLPEEIFKDLYLITPNESETEILTGIAVKTKDDAKAAAIKFTEKGVAHVVITLGSEGAYLFSEGEGSLIPVPKVKAVDTTAAGDVFNGALAVAISEGHSLKDAVSFANQTAAISVTRMGAQSSAPYRNEIKNI